jgi:anti-sigma factor RsiW
MNHPTQQELFEYADGALAPSRSEEIAAHLEACPGCRDARRASVLLDGALRRVRPDRPSRDFTARVLGRLGVKESTPLVWLFLRNFAPVLVAGTVAIAIMTLGSAGPEPGGGPGQKSLFDASQAVGTLNRVLEAFTSWTGSLSARYLAFSVGKDSFSLMILIPCLLAGIGLLDRFFLGPILRRRE